MERNVLRSSAFIFVGKYQSVVQQAVWPPEKYDNGCGGDDYNVTAAAIVVVVVEIKTFLVLIADNIIHQISTNLCVTLYFGVYARCLQPFHLSSGRGYIT